LEYNALADIKAREGSTGFVLFHITVKDNVKIIQALGGNISKSAQFNKK